MNKMNLGSNVGIAGEFRLTSVEDVMSITPFFYHYGSQAGSFISHLKVFALLSNGKKVELKNREDYEYGCSYDKPTRREAPCIGEQIAGMVQVEALVFDRWETTDFENYEDIKWDEILVLSPPDYEEIRRRIEDRLRNWDKEC